MKEYEVMDLKYKKKHETMETLKMAMDETVTVQQLKRDLYAVVEVAIQEMNEYIEIIQSAGMSMLIKLSAKHIEETQRSKVKRHEMTEMRLVVMVVIVTVQVLSLVGFEEEDHQQHQINDFTAHLDIIRIMKLIQNTEFQDEVMAIEP